MGTAICHDSDFFESWRILALKGAEVVLLPHANRTMPAPDGTLSFDGSGRAAPEAEVLRAQHALLSATPEPPRLHDVLARDNAVYAVFSDHVGFDGHSTHVGGAYVLAPDGSMIARSEAGSETDWIFVDLDPDLLRRTRENPMFALRKRRPETYEGIDEPAVSELPLEPLWTPSREQVERAVLTRYLRWLEAERGLAFAGYHELWRWSVTDLEAFWGSLWDFFEVEASRPYERVLGGRELIGAEWFRGAELSYAEHIFRGKPDDRVAIVHASELRPQAELSWGELRAETARVAAGLRALGVERGDRVAALSPEHPRGGDRVSRVRLDRCDLVELLARLRRAKRDRPPRPDRAEGALHRRRVPLRRPRLRPPRRRRRDPARDHEPRAHRRPALPRSRAPTSGG